MLFIDCLRAVWITAIFAALFFWLPAKIFIRASGEHSALLRTAGGFARMVLLSTACIWSLAALRILNGPTLLLAFAVWPLFRALRAHGWRPIEALRALLPLAASVASDEASESSLWIVVRERSRSAGRSIRASSTRILAWVDPLQPAQALSLLIFGFALACALLLRYPQPLRELRFANELGYSNLLASRELLADILPNRPPFVFPALVSALSLLASADPMQVVRFTGPLIGLLLVLAAAICMWELTGSIPSSLVTLYSLGAYVWFWPRIETSSRLQAVLDSLRNSLSRQWSGSDAEIGVLFLLLALACWMREASAGTHGHRADAVGCLLVVGLTAPLLLGLFVPVLLPRHAAKKFALAAIVLLWVVAAFVETLPRLALDPERSALVTLPVGLSLLGGVLFYALAWPLRRGKFAVRELVAALVLVALSLFFLDLPRPLGHGLEYDATARKTLEIISGYPRQHWLIVAPVEQFAESYGLGGYQDLSGFVNRYFDDVASSEFRFPEFADDIFIYVEKQPFHAFAREPASVPFSALSDPTFRLYRSAAGRASVEYDALTLCEAYRRAHTAVSIQYEDAVLRIYHIRPRE